MRVRAAHAQLTRALFQFCETTLPPGEQLPTMRTISAELFDGMETLAALVAEEFAAERDRRFAGSAGERAELVNAILNGEPIDPRLALRQLGYDLTLHHVALVVWRAELSSTSSRDLESTAVRLLETAGCSAFLLMAALRDTVRCFLDSASIRRCIWPTTLDQGANHDRDDAG